MRIIMMRASGVGERDGARGRRRRRHACGASRSARSPASPRRWNGRRRRRCSTSRARAGRTRSGARSASSLKDEDDFASCRAEDRRHSRRGCGMSEPSCRYARYRRLHRLCRAVAARTALPSRRSRPWPCSPRSSLLGPRNIERHPPRGASRRWRRRRSASRNSTRCSMPISSAPSAPALGDGAERRRAAARGQDDTGGPEPIFGDEVHESGGKATARRSDCRRAGSAAATTAKRCADSRATLPARAAAPARAIAGMRRGRGSRVDARRMFRDAMRNAGEFLRLRQKRRRLRQRRIVLLIDVSGSMKERTQATI